MSKDLINGYGSSWKMNNNAWARILYIARARGWMPAGTILYKRSDVASDLKVVKIEGMEAIVVETEGDIALVFEDTKKSQEIVENWDGGYFSNAGQVITAIDAANLADAVSIAGKNGDFGEWEGYHELIFFLREGECMIW